MRHPACFIGVDCGESHHHLSLLDRSGSEIAGLQVGCRAEEIRHGFGQLLAKAERDRDSVAIVVESVQSFARQLVDVAEGLGLAIWQVNPKALHHYRDLEGQPHKDDVHDAFLLARMGYLGMKGCRLATRAQPEEARLRRLSRLHTQLVRQRTQTLLYLRSRLLELCPQVVDKAWGGPSYSSQTFLAILGRWPGFEGLEKAQKRSIERVLRLGKPGAEKCREQVQALQDLAKQLPRSLEREAFSLDLSCRVSQLELLSQQISQVDTQISRATQDHPVAKKLLQMPGIGAFTAATFVGELMPLVRTSSEAQVATYAGLTPLSRRSGKSGKDRFARGTNKFALSASFHSAVASLRTSALDRAYYDKQRQRHRGHPKTHVVATIALARQRHKLIYKLMKTSAHYEPQVLLESHLKRARRAQAGPAQGTEFHSVFHTGIPSPPPGPPPLPSTTAPHKK